MLLIWKQVELIKVYLKREVDELLKYERRMYL